MVRTIDFRDWLAGADAQRARVQAVEAAFAEPYRRERRRDPAEAAFLRQRRTPEDLIGPSTDDDLARRAFAAPRQAGVFRGIDLSLLDPADSDDRRLLVEAEQPELVDALERGDEVVTVAGQEVSPGLHLSVHEIVAEQLWNDDPPEMWETARPLVEAGYERHEIFHMLGSALVPQLWRTLQEGKPADHDEYVSALANLPGEWARWTKTPSRFGRRARRKR